MKTLLTVDDIKRRIAAVLRAKDANSVPRVLTEMRAMVGHKWTRQAVYIKLFGKWPNGPNNEVLAMLCHCELKHFELGPTSFQALPLPALDTLKGVNRPGPTLDAAVQRLRYRMSCILLLMTPDWFRNHHTITPVHPDDVAIAIRSDEDCERFCKEWGTKSIGKKPNKGFRMPKAGMKNHRFVTWEDRDGVQRWGVKVQTLRSPKLTQAVKLPNEFLYEVVECYPTGEKLKNEGRLIRHEVGGDALREVAK